MGVDMGTYDQLIAHHKSVDELRELFACDSLYFLSYDGMMKAVGRSEGYCTACFNGQYPLEVNFEVVKTGFERSMA